MASNRPPLSLSIDANALAAQFKEFAMEVEQELNAGIEKLARLAHAQVLESSQNELSSAVYLKYKDAVGMEEIAPGVWVVTLDDSAFWIEEGIPAGKDMKPDLLKNGKMGKNGKFNIIPFEHSAPPTTQSTQAKDLATKIRAQVMQQFKPINDARKAHAKETGGKADTIGWKKIELDQNGSPRTGLLHKFNFGGPVPGKGNTPVMNGVSVYQSKTPNGGTRRDIFTFRTVTAQQTGKWIHPGYDRKQFLDKAFHDAVDMWENEILPSILRKWE